MNCSEVPKDISAPCGIEPKLVEEHNQKVEEDYENKRAESAKVTAEYQKQQSEKLHDFAVIGAVTH